MSEHVLLNVIRLSPQKRDNPGESKLATENTSQPGRNED